LKYEVITNVFIVLIRTDINISVVENVINLVQELSKT